jgi:hypothetical protein
MEGSTPNLQERMSTFVGTLKAINSSLQMKINKLKEAAKDSVPEEYLNQLDESIRELNTLTNDEGEYKLSKEDFDAMISELDTRKTSETNPTKTKILEKAIEILREKNPPSYGGKRKTKKQRKSKKNKTRK